MSRFKYYLDSDFGHYVHEIECSRSDFKLAYKTLKECKCKFVIHYWSCDYVDIRFISPIDNDYHFFGGIVKA